MPETAKDCMPKPTFAFISLGCPKNLVDSERMLGKLAQDGYTLTAQPEGADVVVVNTCGFIEPARQESLAVIRQMLELKKKGKVGSVVVAGCLAERKKDDLLKEVPEVDGRPNARTADLVSSRAGSRLAGYGPIANYAKALCLPQNLRRMRSPLHLLRHSGHARQACHEADRRSDPRGS